VLVVAGLGELGFVVVLAVLVGIEDADACCATDELVPALITATPFDLVIFVIVYCPALAGTWSE
jgi:hypothetical protein